MLDVKNKWVFITGATRGLGRLAAIQMAKLGCNVIVHSRTLEGSQKICDELAQFGVQTKAVACELSDIDAVKAMLSQIDSFAVDVDIVLNNAGLQVTYRNEYLTTPVEDYVTSFYVNTISPMNLHKYSYNQ